MNCLWFSPSIWRSYTLLPNKWLLGCTQGRWSFFSLLDMHLTHQNQTKCNPGGKGSTELFLVHCGDGQRSCSVMQMLVSVPSNHQWLDLIKQKTKMKLEQFSISGCMTPRCISHRPVLCTMLERAIRGNILKGLLHALIILLSVRIFTIQTSEPKLLTLTLRSRELIILLYKLTFPSQLKCVSKSTRGPLHPNGLTITRRALVGMSFRGVSMSTHMLPNSTQWLARLSTLSAILVFAAKNISQRFLGNWSLSRSTIGNDVDGLKPTVERVFCERSLMLGKILLVPLNLNAGNGTHWRMSLGPITHINLTCSLVKPLS